MLVVALSLQTRRMIASSSVSVKAWGPLARSFSLGRSFAGHSLMRVGYRVMGICGEFQSSARPSLYHNRRSSPILLKEALLSIRLPDDAGSQGGPWAGRVT